MEVIIIIIGFILILAGLLGCFLPALPGPPLSYLGVLLQQLKPGENPFTIKFLVIWGIITLLVSLLDYLLPIYGTKKYGGSRMGVYGSVAGLLVGLFFFPPLGIIIGPFAGALLGELISGKSSKDALRASFGSFVGFLTGTAAKLVVSGILTYHFIYSVF
ncbi:MAG: DUF456 domain-containing protein [Cyclobacteriaceae bacterium]|nr:DUF456 domain-containing protein [Cyclobacteriaceae bacterium]